MKVRLHGFALTPGTNIELSEFFDHLISRSGATVAFRGTRMVFAARQPPYCVGLIVTIQNMKRFLELRGDALIVTQHELASDTNMIKFNFYAVHEVTGRGVYQQYHSSWPMAKALSFMVAEHKALRNRKMKEWREKNGLGDGDNALALASTHFRFGLKHQEVMSAIGLKRLVKELDRLQTVEADVLTIADVPSAFRPLEDIVTGVRYRLSIQAKFQKGQTIRERLFKAVTDTDPEQARFIGSEDGARKVLFLFKNPGNFGEFDYDEFAPPSMSLALSDFHEAPFLAKMIEKMEANPSYFFRLTKEQKKAQEAKKAREAKKKR